ncbi:hypothetical protein GH714_037717 [Hevea brasiliensis]|uniref:Kinesin motor domain-containing protein n=1 Tax=Hevea brasiliensis TaxID=3981 RepID=A0A6A6LUR4_HEVBR|nr:hypothetical protein GH714_037717 [Hevea brasiliensis]
MHIQGLAHAASGYHKVLEDNRKLYNQVQDLKGELLHAISLGIVLVFICGRALKTYCTSSGSIRVYCRVRPFLSGQSNYLSTVDHIEDGNITINTPSKLGKGRKSFSFNKVFGPSATQGEVFSDMQPLIRSVLDGYNVCIFAYGQTGSGKTYTMTGPKDLTEKSLGVNYRALSDLFLLAEQRKDIFCYNVAVQMIEIYNEQVRDLLVTDGKIRNSSQTGLNVPDANLVPVSSTSDVIELMNLGQRNRAVGATALNDRSSRSHSCLTVHVQGRELTSGAILRGCMHLVDLAGSERVDKSEATGDRLKEAQHINRSLSALGDVIASLAQKNPHVPYRNSKLTQLLQDSLGGQAKTLMFVHISPEPDAVGETISTLKFAERVATVELGAARVNKDDADIKELKEQIASLKVALTRKEGETEHIQHSVSGNSERYRRKENGSSNNQRLGDVNDSNSFRQPMGDVGNIEVHTNSALRQKRQSFDLDELLANSPPWPPVISPNKIMERMKRKCAQANSSKIYPEQSYNMFVGNNNISSTDDMDDLDAATSDSSEPDLLWQFNQTKLSGIANVIESKTKKPNSKATKNPDLSRNLNPMLGPSPSRKLPNGVGAPLYRSGRQPAPVDMKRRTGNRK